MHVPAQILIDNEVDRNGTLYEAHDFLLPRQIQVRRGSVLDLSCMARIHFMLSGVILR